MIRESILAFSLITGSNMADAVSTQHVVQAGGYEAHAPGLYGPGAERVVPVKLGISALETAGFVAIRKRHKHAAWVYVGAVVVANVIIARRNEGLADRLRKP